MLVMGTVKYVNNGFKCWLITWYNVEFLFIDSFASILAKYQFMLNQVLDHEHTVLWSFCGCRERYEISWGFFILCGSQRGNTGTIAAHRLVLYRNLQNSIQDHLRPLLQRLAPSDHLITNQRWIHLQHVSVGASWHVWVDDDGVFYSWIGVSAYGAGLLPQPLLYHCR